MTRLPILTFHAIEDTLDAISFSPRAFERGIARLRELGYQARTLGEVATRADFPERTLVLTLDDGFHSVYTEAFPILQRYQMTATVFITTGETRSDSLPRLNGRAMLSWDEIREMHRAGFEFGAHTLTHPDLTRLPLADAEREMRVSKEIIQETLGAAVSVFAYPDGRHNARVRAIAREHFAGAVTDDLGLARPARDRYALARVDAYYLRGENAFNLFASSWLSVYLHLCNAPRRTRRALLSR